MVSHELRDLKKDVSERERAGEMTELLDEVARIKVTNRGLYDRLLYVGDKAKGDDQALRDEFHGMMEQLKREIKTVDFQGREPDCWHYRTVVERMPRKCPQEGNR